MNQNADDKFDEKETIARRDAAIKRMLNTPPKPHSEMKIGKQKATKTTIREKQKAAQKKDRS
jgi:hypothetical protein